MEVGSLPASLSHTGPTQRNEKAPGALAERCRGFSFSPLCSASAEQKESRGCVRGVRRRGCGFLFVGGRMLRRLQQRSRSAAAFNTRRCAEVSQSHLLIGWRCLRERLCSALSELQASGFHFPPAAEERGERGQLVRPTHAAHRSSADSPDSAQLSYF